MKRILVRFDDICPTMNFEQFQIAMDLMDKYHVKPLIGVIPDCQDPDLQIEEPHANFWAFVKELQAKGYTVAMHGSVHVFDNQARGTIVNRWDSEFAGHPYEIQLQKIRKGKEILESHGIHTDIFFAPGHSYDANTLRALAACGFKYMSDGLSSKPYITHGITCIPALSAGMPNLNFGKNHTAVFHAHEWVREDKKYCYRQFVNLMEQYHSECLPWDEYIHVSVGNAYIQSLDEKCHVLFNRYIKPIASRVSQRFR